MLKQRISSAAVMLLIFIVINFYVPDSVFAVAMCILAGFAGWEWARLSGLESGLQQSAYGVIAAFLSLILILVIPQISESPVWAQTLSALCGLFWLAVAYRFYQQPVKNRSVEKVDYPALMAGLCLLGACVYFSNLLHSRSHGGSAFLFLYAMCTVWVMDIGAYFAGKRFGRNKLAPSISPGKTWEGVVGGLLGASVLALIVLPGAGFAEEQKFPLVLGTVLAAGASILGDLYESRMKRAAGFKDSSQLIPGHGGVLDRIDGVIAAIPIFTFAWLWF